MTHLSWYGRVLYFLCWVMLRNKVTLFLSIFCYYFVLKVITKFGNIFFYHIISILTLIIFLIKLMSANFYISPNNLLISLLKTLFISPKMLIWLLRHSNRSNFTPFWFLLFFNVLRFTDEVENGIIMLLWNGLHKLSMLIFGIIQKPLWIKALKKTREGPLKKN